jgi:hypothetical protein
LKNGTGLFTGATSGEVREAGFAAPRGGIAAGHCRTLARRNQRGGQAPREIKQRVLTWKFRFGTCGSISMKLPNAPPTAL